MFQRIAIVNRGEAAMRLIHAVRDLNAQAGPGGHRIETVALHTEAERSAMFVREADAAYDLGPGVAAPLPRPRRAGARAARDRGGRRLGRLGLRRRGPHLRRAVRAHRGDLHRAEPRGDAPARRQDRLQADRRGGRRAGRPVEPGRGRHPRRRHRRGGPDRLPAHAQGHRGRRRARHPQGRRPTPSSPTPTSAPATRRSGPSGRAWSSSRSSSPARGTSRCRSSPTARARRGRSACATARCSAATRRSSRSRPRRCSTSRRPASSRRRPSGSPSRSGTPVPAPSSSSTTRATASSPSSRSTPACRSSTRSPRSSPAPTWCGCRSTSRRAAGSTGAPARRGRARRRGPAQRRGPRPRLRPGARAHRPPRAAGRPRHPGRHRCGRGRLDPRRLRLDDREDHRPRSRPRRGPGPAAPRDARDDGRHRGRRHQQVVHPRPARPARGRRRLGRHRLDRPGARRGPPRRAASTRASPSSSPASRPTRRPRRSSAPGCSRPPAAAARRCSTTSGAPSTSSCAARPTRSPSTAPGRTASGCPSPSRAGRWSRSRPTSSGSATTPAGSASAAAPTAWSPRRTARSSSSRSTASPTGSAATRAASCVLPHRHSSSPRPLAVGDEVAAGAPVLVLESMKMETVLPAPFAARLKELHVATGSQVETGARAGPARAHRRRRRGGRRGRPPRPPTSTCPPTSSTATSPSGRRAPGPTSRPCCSATTSTRGHETRTLAGYLAARDELAAAGRVAGHRRDGRCSTVFADFAELSRNRPVGEEAHVENRVHSPREHFHTYLQTLDPERGGLPADFVGRLERVLGHYGVTGVERSEDLEEAVFRVFLAQQRSAPEVSMATSILQRWLVEPAPRRRRRGRRPRAARPPGVRHPAALPDRRRPRPQRAVPLVRPAARRRRPRLACSASVGDELDADRRPARRAPSAPPGSTRWPPSPSASCGSSASGCARRRARARADARRAHQAALPRVRPARPARGHRRRPGRRDRRLPRSTGATRTWSAPSATIDELADGTELSAAARRRWSPTGPAGHEAVVDLYVHWGDLPHRRRRRPRPRSRPGSPGCRSPPGCAGSPWASCPTTSARSATSPSARRPTGRWTRTGRCATCTRWSAAGSTCGGCATSSSPGSRRPRTCCCCTPSPPATRRTSGSSRSPRCASSSSCATRPARSPRCRTSSGRWPTASRRSAGPGPRLGAGARLDTNHVWLHIWPPVEADLDQLTALQGKVAPMTAGAGIEEVRIEGAHRRASTATPCRSARASPTSRGRGSPSPSTRPPTDAGRAARRLRREGRAGPAPRPGLPLRAGRPWSPAPVARCRSSTSTTRAGSCRSSRPYGENTAGLICGLVTTPTPLHPEGVSRVLLCGDPLRSLGAVAEPECARVIAALDLAEERGPAGRVVRAVGRCPHLDGLRHREHGLGRQGAQADHRVHPGRRARSTSSSPASTSGRSRTGTPRRRC